MMLWLLGALGLTGGGIGIAALLGGGPFMLMAAKWLWAWLSHATFLQVVCVVLGIALAIDHGALLMSHRHGAKVERQLTKCTANRKSDQDAYRKAQTDAAQANKAQVAKVEQQYRGNTDVTKDAYARDHAELVRLRQQRDAAAQGAAGAAGLSQDHAAAAGADGHAVPIPPGDDLQTKDDAADIELRLMHLQNYVEGLLKIDPNAGTAAPSRKQSR